MAKTFEQLKELALAIRDERTQGANTATRIGNLYHEIVCKMEEMGGTTPTPEPTGKVTWGNVTEKPLTFPPTAHTHAWQDLTSGVPTTFTPAYHTHDASAINNFATEAVSAGQGAGFITEDWVRWFATQQALSPTVFTPTTSEKYNAMIRELYLEGSYVGQLCFREISKTRILITNKLTEDADYKTIGRCDAPEGFVQGNIYEINEYDSSGLHGYIILNSFTKDESSDSNIINTSVYNIMNSPTIFMKIFGWLMPKKKSVTKWTTNEAINNVIEELYYPDIPDGASIYLLTDMDDSVRLFIMKGWTGLYDDEGNPIPNLIASVGRNINKNIRNSKPIYSIYDYATMRTHLGYFIPSGKFDYNQQGEYPIYKDKVTNLANSPRTKAMLEDNRQVILLGDSIPSLMSYYDPKAPKGYRTSDENPMEDMLRSMLGCQVVNLCCQGCTYARRGDSYFDAFSGVGWALALAGKSFGTQRVATPTSAKDPTYPRAIANTALIDWNKNTTVISEYGTNDLTIGIPLGDRFNYNSPLPTTITGAMEFTAKYILQTYKTWKMCFVNLFNRTYEENGATYSITYYEKNGLTGKDLRKAIADHAEYLGLPCISGTDMAERNMYSLMTSTCDGTHNNQIGFFALAKFYARIYKQVNGDDAEEIVEDMDITTGGTIGGGSDSGDPDSGGTTTGGGGTGTGGTVLPPTGGGSTDVPSDTVDPTYTNDSTYPWIKSTRNGQECWKSTNFVKNSISTMTVNVAVPSTIHVLSTGSQGTDLIFVTTNNNDDDITYDTIVNDMMGSWKSKAVAANTTIYIKYAKNSSTSVSDQCGWFYID